MTLPGMKRKLLEYPIALHNKIRKKVGHYGVTAWIIEAIEEKWLEDQRIEKKLRKKK